MIAVFDDKMLPGAIENNFITSDVVRHICYCALSADELGVDLIFKACSSKRLASDFVEQLLKNSTIKIDDALVERVAIQGN